MSSAWHVGRMERLDAEKLLQAQPTRSFVVRINKNDQNVVSARLAGGAFVHTVIEQRADGTFAVARTDDSPILATSVQDALVQLRYLAPEEEESIYTAAVPVHQLHNHYVSLPLSPAAPAAPAQYAPVPAESSIARTASTASSSKGSGVSSKGSGVSSKGSGVGSGVSSSKGSGVALFKAPPVAATSPPTESYKPPARAVALPVGGASGGDRHSDDDSDDGDDKKKKHRRHRHRHRSSKE